MAFCIRVRPEGEKDKKLLTDTKVVSERRLHAGCFSLTFLSPLIVLPLLHRLGEVTSLVSP